MWALVDARRAAFLKPRIDRSAESAHRKLSDPFASEGSAPLEGVSNLEAPASRGFLLPKSMNRAQEQEHLAQADRHLAELKAHIVRQSLILRRTLAEGRRLLVAKSTLQALEGSLRIFEKRCELILDQLKRPPSE